MSVIAIRRTEEIAMLDEDPPDAGAADEPAAAGAGEPYRFASARPAWGAGRRKRIAVPSAKI